MIPYIREVSKRTARQMLTAGGANEEVADNGPNGHSVFTWTLMQGLEGRADLNSDGYISAAELASYVAPGVSALSHQTPAFGNLPGSEGGEFIFELNSESELLSQLSAQLDREAIQLNAELERVRKEVASKTARNQQLRDQLTAVKSQQLKAGVALSPTIRPPTTVNGHLNKAENLFKEQRYPEALEEYLAAAKLDPKNARAANDTGFVYYRMGKLDEALQWYQKAVTIDPHRMRAYANLGDLYFEMNRTAEARAAYEKFLDLAPNDDYAPTVRSRLGR
jgi:tetratricopeptide (TPR) repeat protein